jgi:predicted oxidoreductase (fatty acid repression mutant protein)
MKIIDSLKERRSIYDINKTLPVKDEVVFNLIKEATELVPDSFNMKSSRVVVVTEEKHDLLWDKIYELFEGNVPKEKIDSFKNGYGTILYFIDKSVVKGLEEQFPLYAPKFIEWARQSAGMLELSIWSGLHELNIGASLQHYNPIIDEMVKEFLDIPENYELNAQMTFGGINSEPSPKDKEDISLRVKFVK